MLQSLSLGAKHGKRAVKAVDKGIDLAKGAGKKGPKRKGCACKSKDKKGKNKPPTKITFSSESKKHVNDRHIGNKPEDGNIKVNGQLMVGNGLPTHGLHFKSQTDSQKMATVLSTKRSLKNQ